METLPDGLEPVEGEPACQLSQEARESLILLYDSTVRETIELFRTMTGVTVTREDVMKMIRSRETPAQGVAHLLAAYPGDDEADPGMRAVYYEILAKRDDAVRFVAGIMGTG